MGEKEKYPTVIYLKNYKVSFINNIPKDSKFVGKIKWRYSKNDLNIYICKNDYKEDRYKFKDDFTTKNIGLLKSQLQKAIRRKENKLAMNLGYQLMNVDMNQFLRRLAIITLEDVILNQYYPVLIWMMMASSIKGWSVSLNDVRWLLSYINYLCNIDIRENYKKIDFETPVCDFENNFYNELIYSLEIRKNYGGMKGDMRFINWFIKEWIDRFESKSIIIDTLYKDMEILYDLPESRIINFVEGVDFHHYVSLLVDIQIKYPEYSHDEIKGAIWHNSSKINKRASMDGIENDEYEYKEVWEEIKFYKEELSLKYIKANLIIKSI